MAQCDCVMEYGDGTKQRCKADATRDSKQCYLHTKYFKGLCAPIEFDSNVSTPKQELVVAVRDSNGNCKSFDVKEIA